MIDQTAETRRLTDVRLVGTGHQYSSGGGGGGWSPLRHPDFRRLSTGQFTSNVGSWMQTVAAQWVTTSLTSSARLLSAIPEAGSIPVLLLAVPAGTLGDPFDRRRLILVAQGIMLVASACLALLAATGGLTPVVLLGLLFVIGIGGVASAPTWKTPGADMTPISRGSHRRHEPNQDAARLPPGHYLTCDFPVLAAGPTPRTNLDDWTFEIKGKVDQPVCLTWHELLALPFEEPTVDIHFVTKWSKLDTKWRGVTVDVLRERVGTTSGYVTAWCDGGYTTNSALEGLIGGKAWIAYRYDGGTLDPEHGGPARLLVPHLYFSKSAKWMRGLRFTDEDRPGFWEGYGYHNHGDPWLEQRYRGD
jgi:DMSO/TMAO reductase YedYZ molybdopterin-dependent catalytic subunit